MEADHNHRRCWLAAYTRARHEQQVVRQLHQKGMECLLPTYERLVRWSDRIKRLQSPLFPSYVFVNARECERVPILETHGVVQFVSIAGTVAVVSDEEIERLRTCSGTAGDVEPHPYLRIGHRVRVKHGPFAGFEGTLLEKQNSRRLIVTLESILKSIAVNLHTADVEPL